MNASLRLAFVCALAVVLHGGFAAGAVFNVTTTADGGPGSLRQAIIDANASAGADTINVPAGTYTLTIAGANENAAATGDLDITEDVTIVGAGSATTIVDGGGLDRVFDILGAATNVTMTGLTVRNGHVDNTSGIFGGGINMASGTLTLTDVVVSGNASLAGGGIASNGAVVMDHSAVLLNTVGNGNSGGGLRVTTLTATDSTIGGNSAQGQGGGMFVTNLTLVRSTVSGNQSTGDQGGGIFLINGTGSITNSTLSGNTGGDGGGGIFYNPPLGPSPPPVTIVNSTITNNTGSGITTFSPGAFTLLNTIVAGNTAGNQTGADCNGSVASQGFNLIQVTTNCTITGTTTGNVTGVSAQLGPLADNGGPTQTHGLLAGSPAIDAGTSVGAPATDQRGVSRPVGAGFDIGSFEGTLTGPGVPALSIGNVSANEGNAGTTPFTFTVTLSAASAQTVTVNFATSDGTAQAGSDYQAASGTLTFAPGQITQSIVVQVNGDTTVEGNETFFVTLSSPANATIAVAQGTGTIVNDDSTSPPPPNVPAQPIPTLSQWMLGALVLLLALAAVVARRRRSG